MKPRLLIFDSDSGVVEKLQAVFQGHSKLIARRLEPSAIARLPELDAMYLTIVAAERWHPKLLFYESQILSTAESDRMPPYVVVGIALKPDDPRAGNSASELELVIKAVLEAVESHNRKNEIHIDTIGFWTRDLSVDRMDASAAARIIRTAYDTHYQQPQN
jgi:hypothetical protein